MTAGVLSRSALVATFEWILLRSLCKFTSEVHDCSFPFWPFHGLTADAAVQMLMQRFIANLRDNKNELNRGSSSYGLIAGAGRERVYADGVCETDGQTVGQTDRAEEQGERRR